MSLPDTAEYWWDIRSTKAYKGPYVHIKAYDCGHHHKCETDNLFEVDCPACKKHILGDPVLVDRMNLQELEFKAKHRRKAQIKWKRKYRDNPDCPNCGFVMLKRTNKTTGKPFWGCCQYPNCMSTKAFTI